MFGDCYRKARILVTGHTGFKGSWLTQWLLDMGAEVSGLSLDIPTEPSHFNVLGLEKKTRSFFNDVRDFSAVKKVFSEVKPDFVFHLAAQSLVRRAYEMPRETFETNSMGTLNVLEAIRTTPSVKTAILVTSDKCYENVSWEYGYRETDRLGGGDPYSASKACAETIASSYIRSFFESSNGGTRLATVRAGNVIGGGDWSENRIVPDCVRAWSEQKAPLIRFPEATRPWQHVLEPLSGYLWLGAMLAKGQKDLHGEAFNFGPSADANFTVEQLISEAQKTWQAPRPIYDAEKTTQRKEASLLKLCSDKALFHLGWKTTLDFPQTVKFVTEWYLKHYKEKAGADSTRDQIARYVGRATEQGQPWTKSS